MPDRNPTIGFLNFSYVCYLRNDLSFVAVCSIHIRGERKMHSLRTTYSNVRQILYSY
jgi:hypothetical protein